MGKIFPQHFDRAEKNWYLPSPESHTQEYSYLKRFDLILCTTRESERIFRNLNLPTYYLGYTSEDCFEKQVAKDFFQYAHIAEENPQRGSVVVLDAWHNHPEFPLLTAVKIYEDEAQERDNYKVISQNLSKNEMRTLQNRCGVHITPSETEGIDQKLFEAMSTAAVIVTTDAPPMNELIQDKRCLVPSYFSSRQNLASIYYVHPDSLEAVVDALIQLPEEELRRIGQINRKNYLLKKEEFRRNLTNLMASVDRDKT